MSPWQRIMGKDSNKRQELKKQIGNIAQSADINLVERATNALRYPKKWEIVERVATMPNGIEGNRFVICFDYLNRNECLFEQFDKAKGKKLIEILEQVAKCEISKFSELKLIRDTVHRNGVYRSLFSQLSPEVDELKEADLCDGRIFFFITEPRFNIVSIETKHRDIY